MSWFPLQKRKAEAIANGVFLMCLGVLLYTNDWWPWILLALCANLVIRQVLTGRQFDMWVSIGILGGLFVISYFNITFAYLIPAIFIIGGAYLILREYFYNDDESPSGQ